MIWVDQWHISSERATVCKHNSTGSVFAVQGADPWAIDKLGGRTALHYAARRDSVELVQLLVDAAGETGDVKFPNRPGTK